MAVYIDDARISYRGMKMCHMIADSLSELHLMADRLGLKRSWFQPLSWPHYDVCWTKRQKAVRLGAVPITQRQLARYIRTKKEAIRANP